MNQRTVPTAFLVSVGDELLLGRTVDTNAAWLAEELATLGVSVVKGVTVGDEDEAIQDSVHEGLRRAELVLLTGGLGPTSDDRTRGAVASWMGRPLSVDPGLLERLEERFRARGYERLPERNRSQAEVPQGAQILANPQGTAPGLALEIEGRFVVLLPGVPREMKAIFRGDLTEFLRRRFEDRLRPVLHRTLHTTGIPESDLAGRVDALLPSDMGPLSVAFLPELTGVDLRLTARGLDLREAEVWFRRVEEALEPVLSEFGFTAESGDLVEPLGTLLRRSGRRMAVAESCTGGLVAKRLTDLPGSSEFFLGGVVAYADRVKTAALGVEADVLAREGAVSEAVAGQMARGVARALDAEVGVALTGVAGPGGASAEKPVGTVWYAVCIDGELCVRRSLFAGDRWAVRERAAQAALALVFRELEKRV